MRSLRKIINQQTKPYLLIGGSVYVFELVIILLAQTWGANPVWAIGIGFCFGTLLSFGLQKFITFGDKRVQHKIIAAQLIATCALVVFNFVFTLVVAKLLTPFLPAILSRTIALGITTLWNFYIYKNHIFKVPSNFVY